MTRNDSFLLIRFLHFNCLILLFDAPHSQPSGPKWDWNPFQAFITSRLHDYHGIFVGVSRQFALNCFADPKWCSWITARHKHAKYKIRLIPQKALNELKDVYCSLWPHKKWSSSEYGVQLGFLGIFASRRGVRDVNFQTNFCCESSCNLTQNSSLLSFYKAKLAKQWSIVLFTDGYLKLCF